MRNNFRRRFLKNTLGIVALGSFSFNVPFVNGKSSPKVVVIGGGFGGATVSKYIKIWNPDIDVTIIEKNIIMFLVLFPIEFFLVKLILII